MSYSLKYAQSKRAQMQQAVDAAGKIIEDEVASDALKRKMLREQIGKYDESLLEYRKALAEFDIMPDDDPALARQKVIQKSGTRAVAGSRSGAGDALILGAIKHQTEYLMDMGNMAYRLVESDTDVIDKTLKDGGIPFITSLKGVADSGVFGSQNVPATALTEFATKIGQQGGNLTRKQKVLLANRIALQRDALVGQPGIDSADVDAAIKLATGLDATHYTQEALRDLYKEQSEAWGLAAGLPPASEDKLQELIDAALGAVRSGGPRSVPFQETSVELEQLTPEAQAIVEARGAADFLIVRNALSNDGEIDEAEEANWAAFQEARGIAAEDRSTLKQVRQKYGTDHLLNRLEQRGYLQQGEIESKAGRQQARAGLAGMVAPDTSMERLRREAGSIYEPHAVERFPMGLRPPKLKDKRMEPRNTVREALDSLSNDDRVMLDAAIESQGADYKPTEFTRQVLDQLPQGTDARTARARFQKVADDLESEPKKARRMRSNMMAEWFKRFSDGLSKQAPVSTQKDLG
jgi:hypothetical protein